MSQWTSRESWHLRLDHSLRTYVAQVVRLLGDRHDADVLDVAAGSGWLGQLDLGSYRSLDIVAPHDRWDLDTPLPPEHAGAYDVVVCLGALHFTFDPRRSFAELVRALRPGGELVVSVPWLYPPHDLPYDRWRISPRQLWRLADEHFSSIELHPSGSALEMFMHVVNRYVTGPFRGLARGDLDRMRDVAVPTPWRASSVDEIPVRRFGPMFAIVHAAGLRGPEDRSRA